MKPKAKKRIWVVLAAVLVLLFLQLPFAPSSSGAYLYDWDTLPSVMVLDPLHDSLSPYKSGQDITAAWHAFDGGYHYFRIDLASAPSRRNFADIYGIYIDSKAGGATDFNRYTPGPLPPSARIDFIVSSEYEVCEWDAELLMWKNTKFRELKEDPLFRHSENGGTTLEWKIKDNYQDHKYIGDPVTWWAATLEPGHSPTITFDITSAVVVPIPNAAWLLGSGVVALLVLKRRRPKT
jgi:hypothetical protein